MFPTPTPISWLSPLLSSGLAPDPFGGLGLVLGFTAGLMPRRSRILLASAACSACFALHFVRLGAPTGAAMCGLSVLQSLVAARFCGDGRRPAWVGPFFGLCLAAVATLTAMTWNGWPSALAGVGAVLATLARLHTDADAMRRRFLGSALCWAGHNAAVGSAFGLTCDILTGTGLVLALARGGRARAVIARLRGSATDAYRPA